MAASSMDTRMFNAPMQAMINLFRSPLFFTRNKYTFKGESFNGYFTTFSYSHGVTFTSWGENITVTLSMSPNNMVRVDVRSECSVPTQIIDWGKNKENVNAIFSFIYAHLGQFVNALNGFPPPQQSYYN